jgi:protocatechuate 3,4-dioxygenase beta subunit/5-hydroxyisourate hydrolase-like protein (transthyretin family)
VLRHELAHLRRGDLWLALLVRLLALPHWFNPFAWWAVYRFAECAEWACDQAAAGSRRADAADYAKALLRLGAADLASSSCATAARGGSLFVRIRRVISARLSEDSLMKKATILLAAAALVALNVVRVELVAKEPAVGETSKAGKTVVVTGRVVDSKGKPLPGAEVAAIGRPWGPRHLHDPSIVLPQVFDQGKTNSKGRFRLRLPRAPLAVLDGTTVLARAEGHGVGGWRLDPRAERPRAEIRLPAQWPFRGRLVDAEGRPAAGVKVHLKGVRDEPEKEAGAKWIVTWFTDLPEDLPVWPKPAVTDQQGRFTFSGIGRNQKGQLQIRDPRFAGKVVRIKAGELPAARQLELSLAPPEFFEGRVVCEDTGKPAAGARLTLYSEEFMFAPSLTSTGIADQQGRFRLARSAGKCYSIRVFPAQGEPYLPASKYRQVQEGSPEDRVYTYTLAKEREKTEMVHFAYSATESEEARRKREEATEEGEIKISLTRGVLVRGKISDAASGEPVSGARVRYLPEGDNSDRFRDVTWLWGAVSNSDGTFEAAVPPGQGRLLVRGPTLDYVLKDHWVDRGKYGKARLCSNAEAPLDLEADAEPSALGFSIRRGVTVRGRLVGPDGEEVNEAVMYTDLPIPRFETMRMTCMVGLADGRFELRGCDPQKSYRVLFVDPKNEWGAALEIPGKPTGRRPLEIRLEPCGTAETRFLFDDGKPLVDGQPSVDVVLRPKLAPTSSDPEIPLGITHLWVSGPIVDVHPRVKTDKQGRCRFSPLIPGAVYRFGNLVPLKGPKQFKVEPGQTLKLPEIVLARPKPPPKDDKRQSIGVAPPEDP